MNWKSVYFGAALLLMSAPSLNAQSILEGLVLDQVSNEVLDRIHIVNLSNKKETISNKEGGFKLPANVNDLVVFKCLGYQSDTVLLTSLKYLRHYLKESSNMLKTVNIINRVDYRTQYAQTFNKAKVYLLKPGRGFLFYPSSYFSREGRQARKFVRFIKMEQYQVKIDERFNLKTVGAILPIKGRELDAFVAKYRPSYSFVMKATPAEFNLYLMDCYNKFKLIPPNKKLLPSLKVDSTNLH
jgi:hypothetical protein